MSFFFFFSCYLYWLSSFYLWKQHCIDSTCTKACKKKVLIYPVTQCYRYSGNILNCLKNVPFDILFHIYMFFIIQILDASWTAKWHSNDLSFILWKCHEKKWIANFFLISQHIPFIWELTWLLGKYNGMVSCCILQFLIHKIVLLE